MNEKFRDTTVRTAARGHGWLRFECTVKRKTLYAVADELANSTTVNVNGSIKIDEIEISELPRV